MSEVEQTLKRIENNKSVIGILVLDGKYRMTHSSFKNGEQNKLHDKLPVLIDKARNLVRDLDPTNDLTFLRIRSGELEILVSPGDDYNLIVVQNVAPLDQI